MRPAHLEPAGARRHLSHQISDDGTGHGRHLGAVPDHGGKPAVGGETEGAQAGETHVVADFGDCSLGLAQEEHGALDAAALQVAVWCLTERRGERTAKMGLGDVRNTGQRGHVQWLRVGAVHRVGPGATPGSTAPAPDLSHDHAAVVCPHRHANLHHHANLHQTPARDQPDRGVTGTCVPATIVGGHRELLIDGHLPRGRSR